MVWQYTPAISTTSSYLNFHCEKISRPFAITVWIGTRYKYLNLWKIYRDAATRQIACTKKKIRIIKLREQKNWTTEKKKGKKKWNWIHATQTGEFKNKRQCTSIKVNLNMFFFSYARNTKRNSLILWIF